MRAFIHYEQLNKNHKREQYKAVLQDVIAAYTYHIINGIEYIPAKENIYQSEKEKKLNALVFQFLGGKPQWEQTVTQ